MLDTRDNPLALEGVADVIVYRDDTAQTVFYALPAKPRVALDDQGKPQISLVAYGKRVPEGFKARGGILTLTTALQLTPEEVQNVRAALTRRLARDFPQPPDTPPLAPELRPVEWLEGSVELTLVPGVGASGRPSLFGSNQCSFSTNLDARQIEPVLEAWTKRLPDSSITYRLKLRAAQPGSSTTHVSSFESVSIDGVTSGAFGSTTERRDSSPARNPELEFKGPVMPSGTDPEQVLTITPM